LFIYSPFYLDKLYGKYYILGNTRSQYKKENTMPKGYTPIEHDVPNPHPIEPYPDAQTRWSENGNNYVWDSGTVYEKPAPSEPTTGWIQHPSAGDGVKNP